MQELAELKAALASPPEDLHGAVIARRRVTRWLTRLAAKDKPPLLAPRKESGHEGN